MVQGGFEQVEPEGAALGEPFDRRTAARAPVIRSAKIMLGSGQGVLDCLVLDESAGGVMVDLGALVKLPEEVAVQLQGGATYLARRRWTAGSKAGLEFIGGQLVNGETAARMMKIADVLQLQGLLAAVGTLRAARYFDHAELRRAAEAAETAYLRLEAVLSGR